MGSMETGVSLFWIPLRAGGSGFVRMNGRIYEAIEARLQRRRPLDLYHTALEVRLPGERFIVETMWPCPKGNPAGRGVVAIAPVFAGWLSFTRIFRYEVRRWMNGVLPDASEAIGGPRLVSSDEEVAERVLDLTNQVPRLIWGRDQARTGEMWNSNSVVSWLLAKAGLDMETVLPPAMGRAPGWDAGVVMAQRRTDGPNTASYWE